MHHLGNLHARLCCCRLRRGCGRICTRDGPFARRDLLPTQGAMVLPAQSGRCVQLSRRASAPRQVGEDFSCGLRLCLELCRACLCKSGTHATGFEWRRTGALGARWGTAAATGCSLHSGVHGHSGALVLGLSQLAVNIASFKLAGCLPM
eukprot:scaffold7011_cov112-Isochrysis_galbana.AAC.18